MAAVKAANIWVTPYATDTNNIPVAAVMPGQIFKVWVGTNQAYIGPTGNLLVSENITFESITGGTVDIPENIFYYEYIPGQSQQPPANITKLPFVEPYIADWADSLGHYIYAQAGQLNKQGKATPVVMTINMTIDNKTGDTSVVPASVNETATIAIPVDGSPALFVKVQTTTTEGKGVLFPGEKATYDFETDADDLDMGDLTFRTSIPKGTKVAAGSIYPGTGVQNGSTIAWKSSGEQTSFDCGFAVNVLAHPGTKTAVVNYAAAATILKVPRSASGSNKIPIQNYGDGKIDYTGPSNVKDGPVAVDSQCTYTASGWDWNGGDVTVKLNGETLGEASASAASGTFDVPVFKDADLESVLSAEQTGNPVDTIVTGAEAATAEMVAGPVKLVDANGELARALALGGKVAQGEVVTSDNSPPSRLGHLELEEAESAVVLHYLATPGAGSDLRLVFAREGAVLVYGAVRAGEIEVVGGASVKYNNQQSLTGYNTSSQPGVLNIATGYVPKTLDGYCYAGADVSITGNVTLSSPVAYFSGNLTLASTAAVTGSGSIIVIGNLTVQKGATFNLQTPSGFALGVGGKLIIE